MTTRQYPWVTSSMVSRLLAIVLLPVMTMDRICQYAAGHLYGEGKRPSNVPLGDGEGSRRPTAATRRSRQGQDDQARPAESIENNRCRIRSKECRSFAALVTGRHARGRLTSQQRARPPPSARGVP